VVRYILVGMQLSIAVFIALTAVSCASRESVALVGQPVRKPVAVLVRVSDEAAAADELGGTAALVEAVTQQLAERGVRSEIFAADADNPPPPRIEIWVEHWNARSVATRTGTLLATSAVAAASVAAGGVGLIAMAPLGEYSVWSRVYREGEIAPALVRHYSGAIGTISGDASASEGEAVGAAHGAQRRGRAAPAAASVVRVDEEYRFETDEGATREALLSPPRITPAPHQLTAEVVFGGERIVGAAAEAKIFQGCRATTGVRLNVVEFEASGFTATRAEAIDVGATLAVAFPHGAPDFKRHVSAAPARVCLGDGTALARVSVGDGCGIGRLRGCIVVVLARVPLSGGTALARVIRRGCMRIGTADCGGLPSGVVARRARVAIGRVRT
jgi:hypothetical protein